jgi:hypothetical protein
MRQQIPAALANGWPAEFGRHPYPGSGSEAAPRFRHECHLLQRSPSSPSSLAARATPGDLSSHWPWGCTNTISLQIPGFSQTMSSRTRRPPRNSMPLPALGAAPSVRHRHLSSEAGRAEQSDGHPLSFSASSVWDAGRLVRPDPGCEQSLRAVQVESVVRKGEDKGGWRRGAAGALRGAERSNGTAWIPCVLLGVMGISSRARQSRDTPCRFRAV